LKTYIFIPLVIIVPLLIMTLTTQSSSTLIITVQTSKQSYDINETLEVYGNLTYNESPLQDGSVALEVVNPNHDPVVTRTLQTNTSGTYSTTFKLPSDAKLGTYTVYVSSSYKGETATSNTTFKLFQIVQTTVEIEGQNYTITTESNATITNATATKNALYFISSGTTGQTAYVNTTFPVDLNQTKIKVFIDEVEITAPPFPITTTNGTHYFIYFEFTLSTHKITIQYSPISDIAITHVTPCKTVVGEGYTLNINITIKNQGDYTETFNVSVFYDDTVITLPDGKNHTTTTLPSGDSTTLTLTWNTAGVAKGNYTITAEATQLPDETDLDDNTLTDGWVFVTIPGDVNGDKIVNIKDAVLLGVAFGSKQGEPTYNPNADINSDGYINIKDAVIQGANFGKSWT